MDEEQPALTKGPAIRDLVMLVILLVWLMYALASVVQLFRSGAEVISSLPPFWFWGIPLGPYGALYQPWIRQNNWQQPPDPPTDPEPPGAPA